MKRTFILSHKTAREGAISYIREVPDGYTVTVSEPRRNGDQNALLHALLTEIAEQREWAGTKMDCESWKRLLTAAWMRAEGRQIRLVPALDGNGFDALYQRTSELTKAECGSLIDYIQAWHNGGAV